MRPGRAIKCGGRFHRSCKSLSRGSGLHWVYCVRVVLCVYAFFKSCPVRFCSLSFRLLDLRLGRRRSGKLQSFLSKRDCSQTIPSRGTAHVFVSSSVLLRQTRMCLMRIPHRKGHSKHRNVWPACRSSSVKSPHQRVYSSWP